MGRHPKSYIPPDDELNIECVCCGITKNGGEFYVNKWSRIYNINEKKVPICKRCVQRFINEFTKRYDEITALKICCAMLDVPFSAELYSAMIKNNTPFSIGSYLRQMQLGQYNKNQSFMNTIIDEKLSAPNIKQDETVNSRWSNKDKQNKKYVISTVGYDPFDSCEMSEDDRRYCFNTLAGYCDIDGIKDDAHKMIGCIQIAKSHLQVKKIDEMISVELMPGEPNENKIKSLTESKKKLQDIINKIAADNNIASYYNDNSKRGKNTLSQKMKDMREEGYEPVRPNLFDIKTSESFAQVAKISAQSIAEQLAFDDNDYSIMVKEQREKLAEMREKTEYLEEENRNLRNEINDLKINLRKRVR